MQLVGVHVVDYRVRSATEGVRIAPAEGGWGMRTASGGGRAEIDAVVAMPASDVVLRAKKGYNGTTRATVRPGAGSAVTVAATMNADPAVATTNVPRGTLAQAIVQSPRADARRLALAFYYPWFTEYGNARLAEKPAQPRSAVDRAGVLSMTEQARAHGVDGFVVSWRDNRRDGTGYDLALQAAEQTDGYVAPYLEVASLADDSHTTAELAGRVYDSLREALERSASPAALRSQGVPVVFSFDTKRLPAVAWRQVLARLEAEGRPVRLVADIGGAWNDKQWGLHRYLPNDTPETLATHWSATAMTQRAADLLDGTRRLVTATVSPGYDDLRQKGLRGKLIPRDDGRRYEASWRATSRADPDWILITSWNEWFEGTSIEPGERSGGQALQQTADLIAGWKAR